MAFDIALSGLKASSAELNIIGNNIANTGTTGFKKSRPEFTDIYAASSRGTTSIAIGTGVRLASVTQQFTQGTVSFSDNNLDLAINGGGFFILDDNGNQVFSRAGEFQVDRNGQIVNASGQVLQGFQSDSQGNINGTLGGITLNTANLSPNPTSNTSATLNLNASDTSPTGTWVGTSAFGGTPPAATSYNDATSTTVFDSLGNSHILTGYFIKTDTSNTWNVRFQVDGLDVSTNNAKANTISTNAGILTTAGTLSVIHAGELTINGSAVNAAAIDGLSSTDSSASGVAIAAAINGSAIAGVTATVNPTEVNLGQFTSGTINAGEFVINGTNIISAAPTQSALLTAINTPATVAATGVTAAADASNNIILTAADGRNIQLQTDGSSTTATFGGFSMTAGVLNQVQRSAVTITSTAPIVVAGNAPGDAGLLANTYLAPWTMAFNNDGTFNAAGSDSISLDWSPLDSNGNPNGSNTPQTISVDLSNATQFGSDFAVQAIAQNGYTTGRLNQLDVDTGGIIFGRYSNGQSLALGQVVLAGFANEQGLQPLGDTTWGETFSSGQAIVSPAGTASLGLLQSGAREDSNTQLTESLVALIVSQRNFQANAQTISTADKTTQTIINLR